MRVEKNLMKLRAYINKYLLNDIFVPDLENDTYLFHYAAGETVMRSGEPVNYFTILVCGRLRVVSASESGKMVSIASEVPLSLFGDIEVLLKRDTLHNVVADTDVTLIAVSRELTEKYLENSVAFYKLACRSTIEKLFRSSSTYSFMLLYPAKSRLAQYLLAQGSEGFAYHRGKLAEYFGITPRHLGRLLDDLETAGVISRIKRGMLRVTNAKELAEMANHS